MTLPADLNNLIRREVPLRSYSTFKIGGSAQFFSEPETQEELFRAIEFRRREGLPLLVIGRGSNLLISDSGFSGLVMSLRRFESDHYCIEDECFLRVSGGMSLFRLSQIAAQESLGGSEFLCHIPGTVGGAVVMNAGFGRRGHPYCEIKDIFESFTGLDSESYGEVEVWRRDELSFDYRKVNIPPSVIILDVRFRLLPRPKEEAEEEIRANFAYRNAVQDLRFPSAGSTFKNPRNCPWTSGQLLDQVGMKRERIGGAMVSERHANFFLNVDHATAHDVLALMAMAKKRVFEQFGIQLEPEVRYVGSGFETESVHESVVVR